MNVLIINGHPKEKSYNDALAHAYEQGALSSNAAVEVLTLRDLKFNLSLENAYEKEMDLEDDLKMAIEKIKWCHHMVWVHPLWWAGYPALMKGFIDRAFLPGVTYKYEGKSIFPTPLLKGKTARIICTADSPSWYNTLLLGAPATKQLKKNTLEFCGVKPVRTNFIGPIRNSTVEFREKWLQKITNLGAHLS
ncbi:MULTISPECIES: NAD(P)H-dependent oxidoreductase [unclassified Aureispira]|uniref:NAD(P)H-dependent oxidoreductase n=1 Tax=unclassified Aureispira TaxID=2649989 RepID=UPI000698E8B9|nr:MULTISPECIES: NAD(P)H-dependent oxidoreductase [unclassified Aureispira]WMX16632.1 NAD(P)H-dependent oxidoreductase [Aureispira sp. CCB-E]